MIDDANKLRLLVIAALALGSSSASLSGTLLALGASGTGFIFV